MYLSFVLFASPIAQLSLAGYALAFGGVCYYNYRKLQGMSEETAKKQQGDSGMGKAAALEAGLAPAEAATQDKLRGAAA